MHQDTMQITQYVAVRSELDGLHVVYPDGSEEQFVPYPKRSVVAVEPLSDGRLLLIDKDYDYSAVIFHLPSKTVLRRVSIDKWFHSLTMLDRGRVLLCVSGKYIVLSTETLSEISRIDAWYELEDGTYQLCCRDEIIGSERGVPLGAELKKGTFGTLIKCEDGRLMANLRNYEGIIRIDPSSWVGEAIRLPVRARGSLIATENGSHAFISPSRTKLLRKHVETVPFRPGHSPEEDQFDVAVEFWSLDDQFSYVATHSVCTLNTPEAKLRLQNIHAKRSVRISHLVEAVEVLEHLEYDERSSLTEGPPSEQDDPDWLFAIDRFQMTVANVLWEPDETGVWLLLRGNSTQPQPARLRRLGLNGQLSAQIRVNRFGANLSYPLDFRWSSDGRIAIRQFGGTAHFDPALVDGRDPEEIIDVTLDEDGYVPPVDKKKFKLYNRGKTLSPIKVDHYTSEEISSALQIAAGYIRTGWSSFFEGSSDWRILRLPLKHGRKSVDEETFFGEVLSQNIVEVVPNIVELLEAYLSKRADEGADEEQPWYEPEDGIGALGFALRALVLLDRSQTDIWQRYVAKTDNEHGDFALGLFGEFSDRHGWHDEEMLITGIYVAITRICCGRGPAFKVWSRDNLFNHAEKLVSAKRFAKLLNSEINRIARDQTQILKLQASLREALNGKSVFCIATEKHLRALQVPKVAATGPWGRTS